MNDNDFKKIFQQRKQEIPDNGFSKKVLLQLPHSSALPVWKKVAELLFIGIILLLTIKAVLSINFTLIIAHIQQLALFFTKALVILFSHPATFMAMFFLLFLPLTAYLLGSKKV